ncbi:retrotransposon protein, putative, ty1-copia subclass [Tanacetum coccineum]
MIDSRLLPKGDLKTRWIRYVPNKVNTFAWKVMTNSLPTRFNISRRGIDIESLSCVNCDVGIETNDHLFFACNTAKKISKLINRWWDVPFMDINSYGEWRSWIDNVKLPKKNKSMFQGYPKETMGYYFYFPPENKIVVARYAEFFEKNLITQEVSGRARDLEEIQDEDTSPSEITSEIPMEVEGFEPPQEEDIPIRRSERTRRAPNRLSLNVEVEEHSLGDLNEPTSYKAAMLDSESNKWIDAMNAKKYASFKSWNKRFDEEIKRFGLAQNLDDPCVYQKASGSNVIFLILYVDDIINRRPVMTLVRLSMKHTRICSKNLCNPSLFQERAILAPTHKMVDIINERMLSLLPGDEKLYESSYCVCLADEDSNFDDSIYTIEFLNGLKMYRVPHHNINLKIGTPVMLMGNIDQRA